jgi:menaquinone reductase, molybdopterin-binding-like subunit
MKITRRELLTFAGGSVLGALLTPIPWKLLDDSAIWTQNWPLIPKLPRGPESFLFTTCALCPAGCAVKARCVGGRPVSLTGVKNHPVSHGVLCPMGISAHHLAYHPLRIKQTYAFSGKNAESVLMPVKHKEMVNEIAKVIRQSQSSAARGSIAVLDHRPGRTASILHREFVNACAGGKYIVAPGSEDPTLAALLSMCSISEGAIGFDLESTRVVLSFGVPLLDGWGNPGRLQQILDTRNQTDLKLIQAEPVKSRTALQADTWLPVIPGTEGVLALAIAGVIVREKLCSPKTAKAISDFQEYERTVSQIAPESAAAHCGISPSDIVTTARMLATNPSIVLSGDNPAGGSFDKVTTFAIAGLNVLLGNIRQTGGICGLGSVSSVHPGTTPVQLAEVPDHSIRLLFIDGAQSGNTYPLALLQRKLVEDGARVVMMTPYLSPLAGIADYIVPTHAAYESLEEITSPSGANRSSFALSVPLLLKSEGATDPVSFMADLARAAGIPISAGAETPDDLLKLRVREIWAAKRGVIVQPDGAGQLSLHDIASEDDLWKKMSEGGCWIDDAGQVPKMSRVTILGSVTPDAFKTLAATKHQPSNALTLIPTGWRGTTSTATVAPVLSKLFQESHLRTLGGRVHINPATLATHAITADTQAKISTKSGTMMVHVVADQAVMPGVILATVGPSPNNAAPGNRPEGSGILELCTIQDDGSWRTTEATIARA